MRAADLVELLTRKTGKLAALELDRALDNTVGRGEAHGGQHRLALARSAFADKAKAFASRNAEGQLLHGLDAAVLRLERDGEVADIKKGGFFSRAGQVNAHAG